MNTRKNEVRYICAHPADIISSTVIETKHMLMMNCDSSEALMIFINQLNEKLKFTISYKIRDFS